MSGTVRRSGRPRALAVAVAVGGLGLVVAFVLGLVVLESLAAVGVELGAMAVLVVSLVTGQGVAFGGVALGYLGYSGRGTASLGTRIPSFRDLVAAASGYVLAFVAVFAGGALVALTGVQPAQNQVGQLATQNPAVLLLLIPASFLLIGPGEELLFRGIVQGRIREGFGPVAGVVLASAVFAAIHFVALTGGVGGRLATIAVLFLPSLVFGAVYELTGNIVVPTLVHGAYNATLFTLLYVFLRFGEMPTPA